MAKIKWNRKQFEDLRRLKEVEDRLSEEVNKVLDYVGDFDSVDYGGGVEPGKSRSRGYVVTISADAKRDNSENKTLLRALGGGI